MMFILFLDVPKTEPETMTTLSILLYHSQSTRNQYFHLAIECNTSLEMPFTYGDLGLNASSIPSND